MVNTSIITIQIFNQNYQMKSPVYPACSHFSLPLAPVLNHYSEIGPYSEACSEMFPVSMHPQTICRTALQVLTSYNQNLLHVFMVLMKMRHSYLPFPVESNFLTSRTSSFWVHPALCSTSYRLLPANIRDQRVTYSAGPFLQNAVLH